MGGKLQCKACNIPSVRSIRVIQHLVYRGFSPHVRRLRPRVAFVTRGHCDDLRAVEAHAWRTLGVIRQCDRMVHCRGGVGLLSQRRNTIGVCFRRGQNSTWLSTANSSTSSLWHRYTHDSRCNVCAWCAQKATVTSGNLAFEVDNRRQLDSFSFARPKFGRCA